MAESLAAEGYRTVAFADSGWLRKTFGFAQGFDSYDDEGGSFAAELPKVTDWLEQNGDEAFFLFLHTYDAHSKQEGLPYHSPGGFDDSFDVGYAGNFTGCEEELCGE